LLFLIVTLQFVGRKCFDVVLKSSKNSAFYFTPFHPREF